MKIPRVDIDIIVLWRAGIAACGIMLIAFAIFAFLLYQRVSIISSRPLQLPAGERAPLFSPALLDDMKAFWGKRTAGQKCRIYAIV